MRKKINSEYTEQVEIFKWSKTLEEQYPCLKYLNSSLNGIRLPIGLAMKAKRSGLIKGYPDIFLPYKTKLHNGLFIELKKTKGGLLSKEQREFINYLNSQSYLAFVCRGADEAKIAILNYIEEVI